MCGCLSLWGFFSAPQSHRCSLPSILHAMEIRVLSATDSALVYVGLPGTVHWAAPQGRICPLDHSLSHSILDCTPRLQAPQTLEGRPGFSPRLGGEQDKPAFSTTVTTGKRQQDHRGDTQCSLP